MPGLNFKNTDANYAAIFGAVNTQYNEENEYAITYTVIRYDDECVFAYNHETNTFENIKYTKDEEGNFTLGEKETVYVLNLTESENAAIASLKETNGNTFENIVENFGLKSDFEQKKLESEEMISTLTTERDNSIAEYTKLQGEFEDLKTKYQKLEEANTSYENEKKNELLTKYSVKLDSEVIEKYRNDLSNYTYTDLDKNLAYELVKADDSIFSLNNGEGQAIPKADEPLSGIEAALSKYSN